MMSRRSGRTVSAVNAVIATTIVAVLSVVALVVHPPSPPGIAEFAPQASKPITKAPTGQTGRFGVGAGACFVGQVCTMPAKGRGVRGSVGGRPIPRVAGVPSALQCFEWPDGSVTQTFDPQSPPCIAAWPEADKGNGGATSRGVTGTVIRLGIPSTYAGRELQPVIDFFNHRFELYGRTILGVPFTGGDRSPSGQHASAKTLASLKTFATLDQSWNDTSVHDQTQYLSDAAKAGVIAVTGRTQLQSSDVAARHRPFLWSYSPPLDTLEPALGEVVCKQLAKHPPSHSSQYATTAPRRTFGILVPDSAAMDGNPSPSVAALQNALAGCGEHARVATYRNDVFNNPDDAAANAQILATFQAEGITSVVYLTLSGLPTDPAMSAAQNVGYHPEWLVSGTSIDAYAPYWGTYAPSDETSGMFGVASWNKPPNPADEPFLRAYTAEGKQAPSLARDLPDAFRAMYNELLLLASGVQAAGPQLTPATFAAGLEALQFPNPGTGARPYYQQRVGFGNGEPTMVDDLGLVWWNPSASRPGAAPYGGAGAWCFVDRGRRWQLGAFPTTDRFFEQAAALC